MNRYDLQHIRNILAVERQIKAAYIRAAQRAARLAKGVRGYNGTKPFSFADFPVTAAALKSILNDLNVSVQAMITDGVRASWALSNHKNDTMAAEALARAELTAAQKLRYFNKNADALAAFLARKEKGLALSDRVWKYTGQFRTEIENAIGASIGRGTSAYELNRSVRHYLQNPDVLFRRVRDKFGQLQLSKAASLYHPGTGVYRSAFKNAQRMAATEINTAYRMSDSLRWQSMDFVVGVEIHPSLTNHPVADICDDLQGRYPKDFHFTGWHPFCRCTAIPIMQTESEFVADNRRILQGGQPLGTSRNTVDTPSEGFHRWIRANAARLNSASTLPYFITDNPGYIARRYRPMAMDAEMLSADDFNKKAYNVNYAAKSGMLPQSALDTLRDMQDGGADASAIEARIKTLQKAADRHFMRKTDDAANIAAAWDKDRLRIDGETEKAAKVKAALDEKPIENIDDVNRVMGEFIKQYPEETGGRDVTFKTFNLPRKPGGGYYSAKASHEDGTILFNDAPDKGGVSWFDKIKGALNALRDGKPLREDDINALRTIRHEILHQGATKWESLQGEGKGDYKRFAMETMNEFAARTTLSQFLRRMGGNTLGASKMVRESTAYAERETRLLQFIDRAKLNPYTVGRNFEKDLTSKPYTSMDDVLYNFFKLYAVNPAAFTQTKDEVLSALSTGDKWNQYLDEWFKAPKKD